MTINVKKNGGCLRITRAPNHGTHARNGQKMPDFSVMNCLAWVMGAGPVPAYPTKVTYRKHRHVRETQTITGAGLAC